MSQAKLLSFALEDVPSGFPYQTGIAEIVHFRYPSVAKRKIDNMQPSAIYRRDSTFTTVCCGVEMWNYWCMVTAESGLFIAYRFQGTDYNTEPSNFHQQGPVIGVLISRYPDFKSPNSHFLGPISQFQISIDKDKIRQSVSGDTTFFCSAILSHLFE